VTTSGESGQAGQIRRRTILFHKWRSRYLYLPILPIPFLDGEATRAGQKKKTRWFVLAPVSLKNTLIGFTFFRFSLSNWSAARDLMTRVTALDMSY
jgi:hypothetical protein